MDDPSRNTRTIPVIAWENESFDLPEEDYDQRPPIEWDEAEFTQDTPDPHADLRELGRWDAIDPPAPDGVPDWPAD